jgi:hypothetical protein
MQKTALTIFGTLLIQEWRFKWQRRPSTTDTKRMSAEIMIGRFFSEPTIG